MIQQSQLVQTRINVFGKENALLKKTCAVESLEKIVHMMKLMLRITICQKIDTPGGGSLPASCRYGALSGLNRNVINWKRASDGTKRYFASFLVFVQVAAGIVPTRR